MNRYVIIGDIHGCLAELEQLLAKVDYTSSDRLVFCGDLMDRGPDSVGVVRLVRQLNAEVVYSNHEDKHVRYRKHINKQILNPHYKIPMRPMWGQRLEEHKKLTNEEIDWFAGFPTYIHLDDKYTVVHGGLYPNEPIETQDRSKVIRLRHIDEEGKMIPLPKDFSDPPNGKFWADIWPGPRVIVYGHNVSDLTQPRVTTYTRGIDTGVPFGGHLTALVITDGKEEYVQVKSKERYFNSRRDNEL